MVHRFILDLHPTAKHIQLSSFFPNHFPVCLTSSHRDNSGFSLCSLWNNLYTWKFVLIGKLGRRNFLSFCQAPLRRGSWNDFTFASKIVYAVNVFEVTTTISYKPQERFFIVSVLAFSAVIFRAPPEPFSFCQVGRIVDVLKDTSSHHNGFPIIDFLETTEGEVCLFQLFLYFVHYSCRRRFFYRFVLSF